MSRHPIERYLNTAGSSDPQKHLNKHTRRFKVYDCASVIKLDFQDHLASDLSGALLRRKSGEGEKGSVPLSQLGTLLYWSMGVLDKDHPRRPHPSGGAKYPLEAYVVVRRGEDIGAGVYHYNIKDHTLEFLPFVSSEDVSLPVTMGVSAMKNPGVLILLSVVWGRNIIKYGNFGTKLSLIELGHVGQNFCLVATALGVAARPLGLSGQVCDPLTEALKLSSNNESVMYAIALGT